MQVVIANRMVFLPDTASTRHGSVCMLARAPQRCDVVENRFRPNWVRLAYRARGVEPRLGEDDPGYRGIRAEDLDLIVADDLAHEAVRAIREGDRLSGAIRLGGVILPPIYARAVPWRP